VSGRRPRVVYWNNIAAPYMVDRFNALADRGVLDFEAWFSRRTNPDRSWDVDPRSWRFRHRILAREVAGRQGPAIPWPLFRPWRPDLLVSLYAEPSFVAGWVAARARRIPIAFWCEVTYDSWVKRRAWKSRLRRTMFQSAAGIVTAGDDGRRFAVAAGAEPARVHILPHVTDAAFFRDSTRTAMAGRDDVRARLGLRGTTFLYVGRLHRQKGVGELLCAFERVCGQAPGEMSLLLVGDGPEEARLRAHAAAAGLNVVFAGFQQRPQLPALYAAADVFVFPTLGDPYGLVVDEALASGLPVIATTSCGELRTRVVEGDNGTLVPPGDSTALAQAMVSATGGPPPGVRRSLLPAGLNESSPETWARDFEQIAMELIRI
jgi:glycosyltransferase involved in cell wall biosynthesis